MNNILFIIAAGVGSRMNSLLPKALFEIHGSPNINHILDLARPYFDKIVVVANILAADEWEKYNIDNVVYIHSGKGDGHAVREALSLVDTSSFDNISICWGDLYFLDDTLFSTVAKSKPTTGLIPVTFKINPYVTILHDNSYNATGVDSSKYGEIHGSGFQDNGVFVFNKDILVDALNTLHSSLYKGDKYITNSGELFLTHTLHLLHNIGKSVNICEVESSVLSYNTIEELNVIKHYVERNNLVH